MKLSQTIPVFTLLLFLISCDLTNTPNDGIPPEEALNDVEGIENVTRGNYAYLKDLYTGDQNLVMMMYQQSTYRSDNFMISGTSSNPFMQTYNYQTSPDMNNVLNLWRQGYRLIYNANTVIEAIEPGESAELDQLLGENKFLRSLTHFYLVTGFGRPYSQGRDNPGVPIMTEPDLEAEPSRATVGEVFDFLVEDLTEAADLMTEDRPSSYGSSEAAEALLARVYLYMEDNENAVEYADRVIDSNRYELVGTETLPEYFTINNEDRSESIFAIRHLPSDDPGTSAGINSLINEPGWGENYPSESLRNVLDRYESDVRRQFIEPQYELDDDGNIQYDEEDDPILRTRGGFERYYVNKFSGLEGIATNASPELLRFSETYLIKAEALANTPGGEQQALDIINRLRERANIPQEGMYSVADLGDHDTVLDVVLEERRLELFFEGHRTHDLFRNGRTMYRDYPGTHLAPGNPGVDVDAGTQTIPADHPRIIFFIPENEIELNPNLEQNPSS